MVIVLNVVMELYRVIVLNDALLWCDVMLCALLFLSVGHKKVSSVVERPQLQCTNIPD